MEKSLVADIGGTNARFALYDRENNTLSHIEKFIVTAQTDLSQLITDYLKQFTFRIERACLAMACPIEGDLISMTNNNIQFSRHELQKVLNLTQLEVINDFTAVAMSVPILSPDDVYQMGGGDADIRYPVAIYGPGTGLGVAHLVNVNHQWVSFPGEGGHVELPMINQYEDQILQQLRLKFGRVSAERFLSGNGLVNTYQALVAIKNKPQQDLTAKDIVDNALQENCDLCIETLMLFCSFMGRFGGNLALTLNTQGGVYIAGGIVPRFIEFFKRSPFRQNFENKGRMNSLLINIPVYVIVHPNPGLLGAGMYLKQRLN